MKLTKHIQKNLTRGVLAAIPFVLTLMVLMFIYRQIDRRIVIWLDETVGFGFPGMGILLFLFTLYFLGWFAGVAIGKQILSMIDGASSKIPLFRTVYNLGKQLSSTLSLPESEIFTKAVLVEYLTPGMWTIGFVTGHVHDDIRGEELLKVYIPTPPNPTSGTMVIVRKNQVRNPGWSVSDAMKSVLSGGILGPESITLPGTQRTKAQESGD